MNNIYKFNGGTPVGSYCDFDPTEYSQENDQDLCNERIVRSLEVLNAQYFPIAIQFSLYSEDPIMLDATDIGFDGFYMGWWFCSIGQKAWWFGLVINGRVGGPSMRC